MAKRYARLNWQNRPNTATPVSAANLNIMDKGIDDLDNTIEEIYSKRVNNVVTTNTDTFLAGPVGKTLQDQITTLNNNLGNKFKTVSITTASTIETYTSVAYPSGFDKNNCVVIGTQYYNSVNGTWTFLDDPSTTFTRLSGSVDVYVAASNLIGTVFKITLMRTDI